MRCSKCGSRDIDFQEAGGQSICINCGTVLEENTIVSSIEFQETGDRSHVIGQFVAANCSKPYMSSSKVMGRHLESRDSRDTALMNARRLIGQLASSLRLSPLYVDRAYRLYQLALQRNFIFGRRQTHIAATCLYIICRQEKSPFLLIDFSDILQINVYLLGKSFLQFANVLNINLPIVDPALYIHRYAGKFQLGDKESSIITSSLRIVSRLKKDWIATGRRPDGVCAAALLIAARAHNIDIAPYEVADLFRISVMTVKKRLLEFKNTPSAQLNLEQFYSNDTNVEFDPPAFIENILKENKLFELENNSNEKVIIELNLHEETSSAQCITQDLEEEEQNDNHVTLNPHELVNDEIYNQIQSNQDIQDDMEDDEDVGNKKSSSSSTKNTSKKRERVVETMVGSVKVEIPLPSLSERRRRTYGSDQKQKERIAFYDEMYTQVAAISENRTVKSALLKEAGELENNLSNTESWAARKLSRINENKLILNVPVKNPVASRKIIVVSGPKKSIPEKQIKETEGDDVVPLSDSESNNYIFDEEERQKRAALWEMTFGPYMLERARRKKEREEIAQAMNADKYTETGRLKKKFAKKARTNTGQSNATTIDAVRESSAAKSSSKKINYEALQKLFGEDGSFAVPQELATSSANGATSALGDTSAATITDKTKLNVPAPLKQQMTTLPVSSNNQIQAKLMNNQVEEEEEEEEDEDIIYDSHAHAGADYDDEYYDEYY